MSFLWHGLTEQGAQVPVQVDAQGRVIAVDGTPGVSNWERTGTTLSPAVPGDSVDIGSGNISLNADGSATFAGNVIGDTPVSNVVTDTGWGIFPGTSEGRPALWLKSSSAIAGKETERAINVARPDGNSLFNVKYDGSATFAGNITAPNVTFRSADPQFYVKKSKNKDAESEYVGPELDLLAEIARLEALVRNLYETLRIAPPAGWPVWDGNDDVLRQLRR